jgi:hypothetical protein
MSQIANGVDDSERWLNAIYRLQREGTSLPGAQKPNVIAAINVPYFVGNCEVVSRRFATYESDDIVGVLDLDMRLHASRRKERDILASFSDYCYTPTGHISFIEEVDDR